MLYPDFNELVSLKGRRSKAVVAGGRKTTASAGGGHLSPFRGQGLEFDCVREYVPGDDIRSIDWRVTARTGSPHLKLFREERERQMLLCVDMNSGMRFGTRNTFKSVQAARAAALLGWQGISQNDSVGACLFGDVPEGISFFPPGRSRRSFSTTLKMLSTPCSERKPTPLADALRHLTKSAQAGSAVYLISDFLTLDKNSDAEPALSKLCKRCDVVFIAINDPADSTIPPVGMIAFSNGDGKKTVINTGNSAGRDAYAAQWSENRRCLRSLAKKYQIPLVELSTGSDVSRDLFVALKLVAKRRKR